MTYFVNINAGEGGNGTKENPFKHIQQAADIAQPGDEVIVAPGVYREYVNPKNGGTAEKPGCPAQGKKTLYNRACFEAKISSIFLRKKRSDLTIYTRMIGIDPITL